MATIILNGIQSSSDQISQIALKGQDPIKELELTYFVSADFSNVLIQLVSSSHLFSQIQTLCLQGTSIDDRCLELLAK